ncbi:hypothetical protein Patl1_11947 [Pistacia atlantica]|uniref:Uncharacterized protein n=1 Tax=Pistacia atlantica TaxID=434234 RepID=A0ACC1A3P5_9ROSI|nr:hypothetical protein Patl1_11947 [Pistacia atlantica]
MLQGKLPSTLSKCKNLEGLSLNLNHFTGAIPKELENLTQIKWLSLSGNKLQGEIPKELGNLSELELVSLAKNSLMGEIPYEIGNLHNLEYLELQSSHLIGPVPVAIFNISCDCNISGNIPKEIENLKNLMTLEIDGNELTGSIPLSLGGSQKLQEYGREGKVSREGDVYSYGIMLMETFTRKKPTDEIFTEEINLRRWVGESLCNTEMQVVDTNLLRRDDEHFSSKEECVSSILSLAMECTRESPTERISIREVATRLIKIRVKFAKIGTRRGRRVLNLC